MPSERKMIGLRLEASVYAEVEALAKSEMRTLSNMVDILVREGLVRMRGRLPPGAFPPGHPRQSVAPRRSIQQRQIDIGEQIARAVEAGPARKHR